MKRRIGIALLLAVVTLLPACGGPGGGAANFKHQDKPKEAKDPPPEKK